MPDFTKTPPMTMIAWRRRHLTSKSTRGDRDGHVYSWLLYHVKQHHDLLKIIVQLVYIFIYASNKNISINLTTPWNTDITNRTTCIYSKHMKKIFRTFLQVFFVVRGHDTQLQIKTLSLCIKFLPIGRLDANILSYSSWYTAIFPKTRGDASWSNLYVCVCVRM